MEVLKESLGRLLRELGIERPVRQYRLLTKWPEVVGKQIASKATPQRIERGRLYVRVTSPTWRQELTLQKAEILARLNAAAGEELLRDIIFR